MKRLAWPLFGLWVALTLTASVLQAGAGDTVDTLLTPALGVLAWVGALLWVRLPENPIGPILLLLALLVTFSVFAEGVYLGSEDDPDPPLLSVLLVWVDEWIIFVWFGLVGILLPLLFPNGKLPSPRWRPLLWAGVAVVGLAAVATAFGTPRLDWQDGTVANPLAIGGPLGDVLESLRTISGAGFAVVVLISLPAVAVRLRGSSGVERQQLKWFAYSISLLLSGLAAAAVSEAIGWEPLGNVGWTVFLGSVIFGVPLAIAVSILRYRLYDIDVVIRRTLVYAALTATLGAAYLGSVLLIGLAVGRSSFAVAASTLAVAALFGPARARIQVAVDRRFYRRRYDAQQTLDTFTARLRDELDVEAVGVDLAGVVRDAVQPTHVSLWLRSGA
jgi:hypothetical protein